MNKAIRSFKDLIVWKKAFDLSCDVYKTTKLLPKEELYGLVSQVRRSAISIPSNIAEGQQRHNTKEFTQFIGISKGSAAELETQLLIIQQVYGLEVGKHLEELVEIQKMLHFLSKKLATNHSALTTGSASV